MLYLRQNQPEETLAERFNVFPINHQPSYEKDRKSTGDDSAPGRAPSTSDILLNTFADRIRQWYLSYPPSHTGEYAYTEADTAVGVFNHKNICTLDGKLLTIIDPVPGAHHDTFAYRYYPRPVSRSERYCGDQGYMGLGVLTPFKKNHPAGTSPMPRKA